MDQRRIQNMQAAIQTVLEQEKAGTITSDGKRALAILRERGTIPPPDTPEIPGPIDTALISGGRAVDALQAGGKKLFANLAGGGPWSPTLDAEQQEAKRLMAPVEDARPFSSALGGALPYAAVPMSLPAKVAGKALTTAGLPASQTASTILGETALGAAAGAMDYDGSAAGGALGALGGQMLGRAVGRTIRPFDDTLEPARRDLVGRVERLGFSTTPAQRSGSRVGQQVEASMASNPLTSAPMFRRSERNQALGNKYALQAIGETGADVNDEALGRAADRIGAKFDALTTGKVVELDDDFITALGDIESAYSSSWTKNDQLKKVIDAALDDAAKGPITAEKYQNLASQLGKKSRSLLRGENSDPDAAFALQEIREALDDAMERQLGNAAKDDFKEARKQWRNLLILESPGVVNSSSGEVSLPTLANVLKRKDKRGFTRGKSRDPLYEAARFGQAFKPIVNDSGTPTRSFLGDVAQKAMMGGGGGAALGDPATGALLAALYPALMRGFSETYNSGLGRAYLSKGLIPIGERGRARLGGLLGRGGASVGLLGSE